MTITICDVAPRDGLQNDPKTLEPAVRAELVNRLAGAGVKRIEVGSFVNPAKVPQMAGPEELIALIDRQPGVVYAGLALNDRGYDRLRETGLDEVHFAFAASPTFNQRNSGATVEESLESTIRGVLRAREDGIRSTVTIGTSFGCPFEGAMDPGYVLGLAARLIAADPDEIAFADTVGVGVPKQVRHLVTEGVKLGKPVGMHFHNTRNTGIANAYEAVASGAVVLDSSVAGIGGCPFAPRATGNICTDDLVYLLHGEGILTGIDLDALLVISEWLEGILERPLEGMVYKAGNFAPVSAAA